MSDYAVDEVKCQACPLWETSIKGQVRRSGVYGRGSGKLGLWLYGEALGGDELHLGAPFIGDAGKILSSILREINLPEDDLFITNSVRCRPPNNRTPKASEIKTCMTTHAKVDAPSTPPKLIVLLGNVPLKAVLNKQKISENRGLIFDSELFGCKAMATYHPAAIMYNKKTNIYDTLKADLLKAKEFIVSNAVKTEQKHHRILVNNKEVFLQWMGLFADSNILERICDIETTGLNYWEHKIASLALTAEFEGEIYSVACLTVPKTGWWYADLNDPVIHEALQNVLIKPTDFFRGLFDVQFFWANRFAVNFNTDVMVQHGIVDENAPSHKLSYCVSIYVPQNSGYKEEISILLGDDKGGHADLPAEILLDYNINDTYNTHLLNKVFTPIIKNEKLDNFFNKLAMPLERSLTRMSFRGIKMDRPGIVDLSNKYREKIKEKREILFEKAGKVFDYTGSSKDIKTVLFKDLALPVVKRTETGLPSSDKDALEELARVSEVPELILSLRKLEYYLRLYLDGNDLPYEMEKGKLQYVDPKPGMGMLCKLDENDRIHGSFLSIGTISGRPTCPKPNLLNISSAKEIRGIFITDPGWSLIEADYSQAELVTLAHFSQDPQFITDVSSEDFHSATAKSLMKSDSVDGDVRRAAKAINFLKSYGGGAEKLGNTLRKQEENQFFEKFNLKDKYTLVCPNYRSWHHKRDNGVPLKYQTVNRDRKECYVCEADTWLKKWDLTYPLVPQYKSAQMRLWKEQGYIMGIYGRKKRFPPTFNKQQESYCDRVSVNYMCQNAVSETVNRSIVDINYLLDQIFGWTPDTMYKIPGIVLAVYDSIIMEAPDDLVPDIQELMKELMSFPLPQLGISLKTDFKVSKRWEGKGVGLLEDDTDEELEIEVESV